LEFNVPFQHKYGYIRDENRFVILLFAQNTKLACNYNCWYTKQRASWCSVAKRKLFTHRYHVLFRASLYKHRHSE